VRRGTPSNAQVWAKCPGKNGGTMTSDGSPKRAHTRRKETGMEHKQTKVDTSIGKAMKSRNKAVRGEQEGRAR